MVGIEILIVTIITIVTFSDSASNLSEKLKNWQNARRKRKHKSSFVENNPDFSFIIGHISNAPPGTCLVTTKITNQSQEIKYISLVSFNFDVPNSKGVPPPYQIFKEGQTLERLENGEVFLLKHNFKILLSNTLYDYWQKGVTVYATCKSTVEDHLKSNSIEYDNLANHLIPLRADYKDLALKLSKKFGATSRNIEVSLWQLQLFKRVTGNVVMQLQQNNIPIVQFLIKNYSNIRQNSSSWPRMCKIIEETHISPRAIVIYLQTMI